MSQYNFDQIIDRHGTQCKKIEVLKQDYGRDDLLPLWIADMDFAVCPEITEALVHRLADHPIYGYTCCYDAYWQSIIDWQRRRNGFEISREEMTFMPGGMPALGMVLNFFTRPGDRVVLQEPVYYDFKDVIEGNRRLAVRNNLVPTGDHFYRMDLDDLERVFIEQKPRIMVVCNPQNPIGIVWKAEELRQLAALAHRHGVILFSDEVFGDMTLFGHKHVPLATVSEEAAAVTITCGSPGKTFNIPGLKSTWLVIKNPELRSEFYHWVEVNELCNANITALLATEVGYRYGEPWLEACKQYIEKNVLFVSQYCQEHIPDIYPIKPQASFLMWLDCRRLGLDHSQLVRFFIQEAHLALNDGEIYGVPGYCHMRLNVGTPRPLLARAMEQLRDAVARIKR
ncbi:MAG: PatB family C-S lyase [Muribaculaceae bacterium]|nr:PatB family C-S lyase [Muribaculaceae bacterium]